AGGLQYIPFADDDDDFMDYANANLQHVLHHHIPNDPEMESFPAPTHDVNVLAEMLWKIDMSTQAGIDMSDYYYPSSSLWQETM
ncbi:hypothetical protein A2U01_0088548, partial [Trifolium medium]|nr:hypothetical protein [Trifolium medium]